MFYNLLYKLYIQKYYGKISIDITVFTVPALHVQVMIAPMQSIHSGGLDSDVRAASRSQEGIRTRAGS